MKILVENFSGKVCKAVVGDIAGQHRLGEGCEQNKLDSGHTLAHCSCIIHEMRIQVKVLEIASVFIKQRFKTGSREFVPTVTVIMFS